MQLTSAYSYGDIVYLKTDIEQLERMVVKITFYPNAVLYGLACGTSFTDHYEMEISNKKDLLKQLNLTENSHE